jgi:hypothetical protein
MEELRSEMRSIRGDSVRKKDFEELRGRFDKMNKEVVGKKEVDEVKKSVEELKSGGPVKIEIVEEVKKTFAEIISSEKQKEESDQSMKVREREMEMRMKEVIEREKRKLNVVVMGLPEVSDDNDSVEVRKMFDALVEEVAVGFQVLGRIGKKGEKPRPVRVKMIDLEDKRRILFRAKNLKKVNGMEALYIMQDLSKAQQDEDKKLRSEVRRLREAGETNVRISKGVIVIGERVSNNSVGTSV